MVVARHLDSEYWDDKDAKLNYDVLVGALGRQDSMSAAVASSAVAVAVGVVVAGIVTVGRKAPCFPQTVRVVERSDMVCLMVDEMARNRCVLVVLLQVSAVEGEDSSSRS